MLQEALKPLTTSMKLFGIYHLPSSTKVEPSKTWQTKLKETVKHINVVGIYSFAVMILIWANFLRYIPGMMPFDSNFSLRIIILIWFGYVAFISTIMFIACGRYSHLQLFYKHWNIVFNDASDVFKNLRLSNFVIIGTVVSWIIALSDLAGIILLFFMEDTEFKKEVIRPFPNRVVITTTLFVIIIFAGGIIAFSISFVIILCHIIKLTFNELSEYLILQIKDGGHRIPKCLMECRQLHVDLCECVTILDRSFGMLLAVLLGVNVPLACFILYQFVSYDLGVIMLSVCVLWFVSSVLTMLVVTISAALVHEAVRPIVIIIYSAAHNKERRKCFI